MNKTNRIEYKRELNDMELVEQLGSGIPRIIEHYGKECFHFSENFLRVVFPASEKVTPQVEQLLRVFKRNHNGQELQELLGLADREHFRKKYLQPALDDDFEWNSFDDEEFEKEQAEREKRLNKHPLFLQAKEILLLVDTILDTCSDKEFTEMHSSILRESAMIINAKLYGALGSDSYLVSMQNAAIIRDHAEYLRLSNHTFNMYESIDKKYIEMFREEMEKFRLLFIEWIKEVRKMDDDFEDEWGLFIKK